MEVGLICSASIKPILEELLTSRNISIEKDADIYIVERHIEEPKVPQGVIIIVFELSNIDKLINFLDQFSKEVKEKFEAIVGKYDEESYEIIPFEQVYYFEARGNLAFCITLSKEYKIKEKLYELETKLPSNHFIRVNKSVIVNISNVKQIIPWFDRRLILRFNSSKEVEVAKRQVKKFKEFLGM